MLQYNTHNTRLPMPEYGRYVQQLVDKCVTIEDRDERNAFAAGIVATICNLFPQQKTSPEWRDKLWDHLAIMSDFKLDVDLPFELVHPEEFSSKPEPVAIGSGQARRRIYGCLLEMMISEMAKMEPGEERDALVVLLANHMKKLQLAVNPEGVDDEKIFKDLYEMTDGVINIKPEEMHLHEFAIAPVAGKKKKKK